MFKFLRTALQIFFLRGKFFKLNFELSSEISPENSSFSNSICLVKMYESLKLEKQNVIMSLYVQNTRQEPVAGGQLRRRPDSDKRG